MTDRASGLRFDIYERVHLPDEVAAIEELEEIELVPHMQALNQADQLLLKGHLLLTGIYRSLEQRNEPSKLEHWIPVEISLPPNRVQRMEDLTVEIDNFDVDLLSTRSLNVTGVLALRGIHNDAQQPPVWREDSFTVVHQARSETSEPNESSVGMTAAEAQASEQEPEIVDSEEAFDVQDDLEEMIVQAPSETESWETDTKQESDRLLWSSNVGWGDITDRQQEEAGGRQSANVNLNQPDSKPGVKVAMGVKTDDTQTAGGEWLSLLGDKRGDANSEVQAVQKEEDITGDDASLVSNNSSGDELEWKSLFLSTGADPEAFCKVRMCIVQREDTIEGIAARYNVQPRELQLRNQLGDPYLSEGQVLYIP